MTVLTGDKYLRSLAARRFGPKYGPALRLRAIKCMVAKRTRRLCPRCVKTSLKMHARGIRRCLHCNYCSVTTAYGLA